MLFLEILGVIIISLFISAIFFYGFSVRGPWGSFWSFLLILFGGVFFLDLITDPVGPIYWDVAWFDLFFFGILFALLIAASTPSRIDYVRYKKYYTNVSSDKYEDAPAVAVGLWFWILFFVLIAGILISTFA